jgi:pimeloyl-ACP methyl ester carboxylesterase
LAQIEAVQRIWPATRLCALDDCGHAPQRDQPRRVIAETLALFRTAA